jgi:hypothetical protein
MRETDELLEVMDDSDSYESASTSEDTDDSDSEDGIEAPPITEGGILRNGGSHPPIESPGVRSVKFADMTDIQESNGEETVMNGGVEDLQNMLTNAQIALSAEKTLRIRKEKNVATLAKELENRNATIKSKDAQIVNVSVGEGACIM